jgi:hypothetical protein
MHPGRRAVACRPGADTGPQSEAVIYDAQNPIYICSFTSIHNSCRNPASPDSRLVQCHRK